MFHFNRGHLANPEIPMWVLKTKGESYYVNHVTASCSWTTKETPDNPTTKGSLKFKNVDVEINEDKEAIISASIV